jgi:hypothetical protein
MSDKPNDFPPTSRTTVTIGRIPAPPSEFERTSDNRFAVDALLGYTQLPAPSITAHADAVYVTVTDVDDLEPWLVRLGGVIHVDESAREGLQLWTLNTATPPRKDGSQVPIRVTAVVVVGEFVLSGLQSAVAA